MKVFISWSGTTSQQVANALRNWLPSVIQAVNPFVSSEDINKGERWQEVLAKELEDAEFGIICLTPYNVKRPWLYFEAGALSKSIDRSRSFLSPFLFRVNSSELKGPLSQFQSTIYDKKNVFNLLSSINNRLGIESRLEHEHLRDMFDDEWHKLKEELDRIEESQEGETETEYEWLYTPRDLGKIEVNAYYKSIWVVTRSPYEDLQNSFVQNMVQKNIERGIKYTFILPSSDQIEEVKTTLKNTFSSHLEQLTITIIPKPTFHSLAVTHYYVLNPEEDPHYTLRVFLKLPLKQPDYWIEVDYEAAYDFAARFRKMIEKGITI
ncbi:MAG: TIR domain-containing protein [Nostoc sp.]|uniref:TIR domain-containing protein n=1 Tax=Nostoc sp. TaxID=1180 RepID=UPI002FF747D1